VIDLGVYRQVWVVDTEFHQPDGERPRPICDIGRELHAGAVVERWLWDQPNPSPPFAAGPDVLVVCYHAPAEWSVYLALGWPLPVRILDLYAEYRWLTSGAEQLGYGQLDAMDDYGIPHMDGTHKQDMRSLCVRGGPFTPDEAKAILAYCREDVDGLVALLRAIAPVIDWPRALVRGRYTAAVGRVEAVGVPIDLPLYRQLREHREAVRAELVRTKGAQYGVYDADGRFDTAAFEKYVVGLGILDWPRTPKAGQLSTEGEVLDEAADIYPELRPLVELRSALAQLKDDGGLSVGADGRNRSAVRPWATTTGRNAPSTTKAIFGKSKAFRSLIRPAPGTALAYVDWEQQEFGIAAALSGDRNMLRAYESGDPYLELAKQAGAVPPDATKESHDETRDLFKTCVLGVNYSMGAASLARRIKKPLAYARELLGAHQQVYRDYWRWAQCVQDEAMLTGRLRTVLGWQVNVGPDANWRSLRNFPIQAAGAELLRMAACLATERGVRVVALVHDAVLVEAAEGEIDLAVCRAREAMDEASRLILGGFTLRTEVAAVVRHPGHYSDKRGAAFWASLLQVLRRVRRKRTRRMPPRTPPSYCKY
jgi:hypothetical protein